MALDVEAVLQAQRAEFVIAQLAGFPAANLVAELGDALVDQLAVDGIVCVHEGSSSGVSQAKTSLLPISTSMEARMRRRMCSGTLAERWLPTQMPGSEPSSRAPSSDQSTLPSSQ